MAALLPFLHLSHPALLGQVYCCSSSFLNPESGTLKVSGTVGSFQGRHPDGHTPVCQLCQPLSPHAPLPCFLLLAWLTTLQGEYLMSSSWSEPAQENGNVCTKNAVSGVSVSRAADWRRQRSWPTFRNASDFVYYFTTSVLKSSGL